MDTPTGHELNADQITYWNGPAGQRWADRQAAQDVLLGPVADILIDRAGPKAGKRVIDIGCGSGVTTIAFAPAATCTSARQRAASASCTIRMRGNGCAASIPRLIISTLDHLG